MNSSPLIVLDSGLGGLTVVRALRSLLPAEDILYFGDTARLPYGSKSAATVTRCVREILTYFEPYKAKHVVVACNTATALALPALRAEFPHLSISGVIEPGARAAIAAAGAKPQPVIGVIATEATVRSKAYDRAILRRRHLAQVIHRPTPLLVPLIEEGRDASDPLVTLAVRQYLHALVKRKLDVLVLGCTHYPILKDVFRKVVGDQVSVIDSAEECAQDVTRRLVDKGLLRDGGMKLARPGRLRCYVTDDAPKFATLASRFLGKPVDEPTWVSPDDLYALSTPLRLRMPA